MTPKEKFIRDLYNLVRDFEDKTGVEIFKIGFSRINNTEAGDLYYKTVIVNCELEIK